MSRTCILGLGLMGGSLARALRVRGGQVSGWSPDEEDRTAAGRAGVDVADSAVEAAEGSDVVVAAAPLGAIAGLLTEVAPVLSTGAVVTDVASLQLPVLAAAVTAGVDDRFVAAHPMVGGERSGFAAGSIDLYGEAPLFLSAGGTAVAEVRQRVERFWKEVGARPVWIEAEVHDARMSRVSHLPQAVATALADALAARGVAPAELGPGGRDTTRLAASAPSMWRDLFEHADPALAEGLRAVAAALIEDADALEAGSPGQLIARLERAGAWRREA